MIEVTVDTQACVVAGISVSLLDGGARHFFSVIRKTI